METFDFFGMMVIRNPQPKAKAKNAQPTSEVQ